jgi:glycerol-3-phosphate acyltransferase PlsY
MEGASRLAAGRGTSEVFVLDTLISLSVVLLAYGMGAVPTGILVARLRGIDIRKTGSGNIGATNVLRSVGPAAALVVLLIDPLKGVLAVLVPKAMGLDPWWVAAAALAAVLGNVFNVFLRGRGGKGVATSFGVFIIIDPWVTLTALVIFILTLAFGRMVSLGSLVAVSSAPVMLLILGDASTEKVVLVFLLAGLMVWRHRDNIVRLAQGVENRLGAKRPS